MTDRPHLSEMLVRQLVPRGSVVVRSRLLLLNRRLEGWEKKIKTDCPNP